ncbi:2Fe-2S iron-sulfur cluster binding domain-containing protein [Parafrankia irregularis]|uniref:2Fe-2S iron-sulfur cluster binding domain-containing protein n=1 Tax=Parafrankia irregularis TaxID=795642 RepID=A0A0S4QVC2_9ACTN|nr:MULTISPECIES: 2Fe-2S iron-sulfur cluster-binding protein [Parafrankia]MBE3202446.1 2Fe-2S iron-sulfur cluster binding domain-containing protein [Parafrankia sp. CH37]CUU58962.1 2Fe-2S iron-sulfur cluster binding domain-containing protein [Parafrankia irregularis]
MKDPRPGGPVVRVEPLGVELTVESGETIIEAAWRLGYHWPTTCHGQGACTVCRLEVVRGAEHLVAPDAEEVGALEPLLSGRPPRGLVGVEGAAGVEGVAGMEGVARMEGAAGVEGVAGPADVVGASDLMGVGNLRLACRVRVTGDAVVRKKGVHRVQTVTLSDDGLL